VLRLPGREQVCRSEVRNPVSHLRNLVSVLVIRYAAAPGSCVGGNLASVYFTDRGIEELAARRGEEEVSLEWLADQLRTFVDLNPEFETPIERFATWLARLDDDEE
jgi:hypothetical protein